MVKVRAYGFNNKIGDWVTDYLEGRKQRVVLGESESDWGLVTSGVPQEAVLAPTLFILYINDLPECMDHIFKIYADDGKLIAILDPLETEINRMQADINMLKKWCYEWGMELNSEKC
jgi:hypothetical protein